MRFKIYREKECNKNKKIKLDSKLFTEESIINPYVLSTCYNLMKIKRMRNER
jgi:hypothetical protein